MVEKAVKWPERSTDCHSLAIAPSMEHFSRHRYYCSYRFLVFCSAVAPPPPATKEDISILAIIHHHSRRCLWADRTGAEWLT